MVKNKFYIDSLDGVRAIAVLLVFFAHTNFDFSKFIPGGFGVTTFFFLSGYLITTLMRMEYEKSGTLSFKKFYLRRIYRIFPPLYIVLIVGYLLGVSGMVKHDMDVAGVLSQLLHFTNYYSVLFSKHNFVPGTSVLWSLAVEEHYYLVFPALYLFLMNNHNRKHAAMVLAGVCLIILIWRCQLVFNMGVIQPYTYKATDTRMDSIVFGCIMALVANPVLKDNVLMKTYITKVLVLLSAVVVLMFCLFYRDDAFRQTFRYTLQGIALFPIFYLAISESQWSIFKWLNFPALRGLGVISYTFYLSHVLCLNLAEQLFPDSSLLHAISGFLFTVVFSTLMYIYVEKYFATQRKKMHG